MESLKIIGIASSNYGEIVNCKFIGQLNPTSNWYHIAGIVGENYGLIKECGNEGTISYSEVCRYGKKLAGICIVNYGTIDTSFNRGLLKNIDYSGADTAGISVENHGIIDNCYNSGKIEHGARGSGIVVENFEGGMIKSCYNIGIINAHQFINSANIANCNWGSISGCYYLESNSSNDIYGEGLSFTEMQQQESFEGFDFDTIWQIDSDADYYFPTLRGIENKTILPKNVETELITTNSITLKNIKGYEYSIDGENYQDSNMFENLTSSTEYTIYQRIKKTETTDESIAAYTSVKTLTYIGDVNEDGKVNITDVALINAHVKKTKLLTGEELARADINGDGKVNITDVALVNAHVKKVKLLF